MYVTYWRVNLNRVEGDYLRDTHGVFLGLFFKRYATLFASKRSAKAAYRVWQTVPKRFVRPVYEPVRIQVPRGLFGYPLITNSRITPSFP